MINRWLRKRRVIALGTGLALVLAGLVSIGYLPSAQGAGLDFLSPGQNLAQPSFEGNGAVHPVVNPSPNGGETWEEMHQACENGDYEAMAKGHDRWHGEKSSMSEGMMGGDMMGSGTWHGGMMGGTGGSMGRVTSQ